MSTRFLNGAICLVGVFLIGLSVFGTVSAISAASVIGGATARCPSAYPAIAIAEKSARSEWLWCRIAGGTIVLLSIGIDLRLRQWASAD